MCVQNDAVDHSRKRLSHRSSRNNVNLCGDEGAILVPTATMLPPVTSLAKRRLPRPRSEQPACGFRKAPPIGHAVPEFVWAAIIDSDQGIAI